jgi:hypothetical protein
MMDHSRIDRLHNSVQERNQIYCSHAIQTTIKEVFLLVKLKDIGGINEHRFRR